MSFSHSVTKRFCFLIIFKDVRNQLHYGVCLDWADVRPLAIKHIFGSLDKFDDYMSRTFGVQKGRNDDKFDEVSVYMSFFTRTVSNNKPRFDFHWKQIFAAHGISLQVVPCL